ncbi:MAG: hypothetical protein IIC12_05280 [Proteobacteria bacterium]|nr:hypothetical protein [Pseudomonadota bacterium]
MNGDFRITGQVITEGSATVKGNFEARHVSSDSFVYKEVDESLNSSVTLQADDELKMSLKPSTTYHISALEFHIQSTNATPDFDFAFNYTVAQSTIELTCLIADKNNTLTLAHFDDFNVEQTIDLEANIEAIARCHGTIITGPGSNGEFQLLWAQNVSNGADIIVEARALMRVSVRGIDFLFVQSTR